MEVTLDYEGYFLISAFSGEFNPYYHYLDQFMLFNPKVFHKQTSDNLAK